MSIPREQSIYHFLEQPAAVVYAALDDALRVLDDTLKDGGVGMADKATLRTIAEIKKLREVALKKDESIISVIDKATVRMLDVNLLKSFAQNLNDPEIRGNLSEQLVMVSAAVGELKNIEPVTLEEFSGAAGGGGVAADENEDFYRRASYLYTVRMVLEEKNDSPYIPPLVAQLYSLGSNVAEGEFDWSKALLFSHIIRVAWNFFPIMSGDDQAFLLENYLYLGVVVGAPVKRIIERALENASLDERSAMSARYAQHTEKNGEIVPVELATSQGRLLIAYVKSFIAQSPRMIDGFMQEQFVSNLYGNQVGRSAYISWLREALSIALHLEQKDWVTVSKTVNA